MLKRVYIILLISSVICILTGFLLAGAGHGWVTAFYFSFYPLLISPLVGYGLKKENKYVLICSIAINLCIAYVFYFKTIQEGEGYFDRVINNQIGLTIVFLGSWLVPMFISLYGSFKKQNRNKIVQECDATEVQ